VFKIAPVSGDLLVKLAVAAAAIGGAWLLLRSAQGQVASALDSAAEWGANLARTSLNPLSDQNLAYQGASAAVSAATGRDETVGGWVYSVTHPDPVTPQPSDVAGIGTFYGQAGNLY
jgi:hypothetical protein